LDVDFGKVELVFPGAELGFEGFDALIDVADGEQ
jgi:hypothetical protein